MFHAGLANSHSLPPMKMFLVKVNNRYVTQCRLTALYITYELTDDSEKADRFNDFDSKLVLKRLRDRGHTNITREEAP